MARLLTFARFCVPFLAVLVVVPSPVARGAAATITRFVAADAPNDPGPNNPNISDPLEDGSPAHPFDRVQEAIVASSGGDHIFVLPGVYHESINPLGRSIELRSIAGPAVTILDGDHGNCVIRCTSNEPRETLIEGFTIRNGSGSGSAGGVHCAGSRPTIRHNVLTDCSGFVGGALGAIDGADPLVTDNVISDNTGAAGGAGLFCHNASATLQRNVFDHNVSELEIGGAINGNNCAMVITDNLFAANAGLSAGGVNAFNSGPVEIRRNRFIANSGDTVIPGDGGGIAFVSSFGAITDNAFVANFANDGGGAVYIADSSPELRNNTFVANRSAGQGAALRIDGSANFVIRNSIFWQNVGNAIIGGTAGGGLPLAFCDTDSFDSGAGVIHADPRFADLVHNDVRLRTDSPCRNAGDPAFVADPTDGDFQNQPRRIYGRGDIGADEFAIAADLNLDGVAAPDDLPPLLDLLVGRVDDPHLVALADLTGDGRVDGADVQPFVAAILMSLP
ncbi:MAG: right-handed parallel beta-helix repeat-containing protein [Phycisphaerae bacterium]